MDNINFKKVLGDEELFDQQANYEENFEKINQLVVPKITALESGKVDKVAGKGLSTHDFDNTYKQKIDVDIPAQLNEKANKEQGNWITPTLLNGATAYLPVAYMKDDFGFIHFKGAFLSPPTGVPLFNIPLGYRPKEQVFFPLVGGSVTGRGTVSSSVFQIDVGSGILGIGHISYKAV